MLLLLIGLTHLAQAMVSNSTVDAAALFHRFFPPHVSTPGRDPFGVIETLLVRVSQNRGQISLYAVPAFVWFSTRLFAGIRTSLNEIYDISARPAPRRHFLLSLLYAKLRDIGMVLATVVLFLANTVLTTGLALLQSRGARIPELAFFVSSVGRLLGELLAFSFSVSLFYLTYAYASPRRLPWRTVLLASTFTAAPVRSRQAALQPVPRQLRLVRGTQRRRQHRRGRAARALDQLHRDRLPARRGRGRDLGAADDAAAPAREARLSAAIRDFTRLSGRTILLVPQVRRAPAREPRQDLAGSSAKRCPVSLRGAWGTLLSRRPVSTAMIALARRYRPKRFADLMVQDHVAAVLRGAVARGRVGHGYLLTGPRGVGKTTAARILAMALNCPNRDPSGDPCGECESCLRVWNGGASLDVIEIDAASNRGVDDARDLRERAMYAPSEAGHHKVYIVDEAHMLTREAWNALLKILEEPPPGVVFVFATTEPQKIAATAAPVLSRLQRFDFRRIGPASIRERLRQVLECRRHRGRRRCADPDRAACRRRDAGRPLGARPVPELRRGGRDRRAGARGAGPGG